MTKITKGRKFTNGNITLEILSTECKQSPDVRIITEKEFQLPNLYAFIRRHDLK